MRNVDRSWIARYPILVVALIAGVNVGSAADDSPLANLAAALEARRGEQVEILAPRSFAAAAEAYEAASKDSERGRSPERISKRVAEGEAALKRATEAAAAARQLLGTVIKTREDALRAQAPKYAGELWTRGSQRFRDAMIENETGDMKNAQRRGAEAEVLLREAELNAVKGSVLNEARALIAQADEAKVDRFAPRTLQAAKRYLLEAEQEIQRNRYELALPRNLAAQASYEARHASYLAKLIANVEDQDGDEAGLEALILSWEEPIKRIASNMDLAARFDDGVQPALKELGEHVQQQQQELSRLRQELQDREEQMTSLNAQFERLEARLGGVSEERVALQRRVDAQERLRGNVALIESTFTADEARVYRQGDDVVMSLLGIKFPSGRSTIETNSAPLMAKVRQSLALFPGAPMTVEGHTDAHGSDSTNLILSQDRADAVKQYIVTNFGADPERITSIGYGEARPVSTNETAEGRARNRRIDLVIHVGQR
jgi:outer membrane protein OmpA-like peptidoglycan-associated protein